MKNGSATLVGLVVMLTTACYEKAGDNKPVVSENGVIINYNAHPRLQGGKPFIGDCFHHVNSTQADGFAVEFQDSLSKSVKANISLLGENIWAISLSLSYLENRNGKELAGFFFDEIPGFKEGVQFWRYKPWNSWTKPIKVSTIADLQDWDVQFFYWQYTDGTYGAAIPLSGNGYRSTLGSVKGKFGCKAFTYTMKASPDSIPMMAFGFGEDPYMLFNQLYRLGLEAMGKKENLRDQKTYPEPFEYIGWCTWNSSNMGRDLNEKHLLEGVSTFTEKKFPLGWLLIDDGWFDHSGSRLNAFTPDKSKFPNGFMGLVDELINTHHLRHVGIWHAYNGYWNGINPDSELGKQYKDVLFSWVQKEQVQDENSPMVTYHFIKPDSDSLRSFYAGFHNYLKSQGFSFVKVDNQLVSERMCVDNYPVFHLAKKMHEALYASVDEYFNGAIINCMDMTNDVFYNFGSSAVARAVEDYFPEADGGTGYRLEKGGAAAHVLAAVYNSLYFSQMVWPDYDMFESYNSNAWFHAAARAISGGPVYVTDKPGRQKFEVLHSLIDAEGRILRADVPGLITEDCLLQVQAEKPLKVFSHIGDAGLLAIFNAADADEVSGSFTLSDINGLEGDEFAVYEYFSGELFVMKPEQIKNIILKRMECKYYNIIPIKNKMALIGLSGKFNAPKTIVEFTVNTQQTDIRINGSGEFLVYMENEPSKVIVNGIITSGYQYEKGMLIIPIPKSLLSGFNVVTIKQ